MTRSDGCPRVGLGQFTDSTLWGGGKQNTMVMMLVKGVALMLEWNSCDIPTVENLRGVSVSCLFLFCYRPNPYRG